MSVSPVPLQPKPKLSAKDYRKHLVWAQRAPLNIPLEVPTSTALKELEGIVPVFSVSGLRAAVAVLQQPNE